MTFFMHYKFQSSVPTFTQEIIKKIEANDRLLVYFTGHSSLLKDLTQYFPPELGDTLHI